MEINCYVYVNKAPPCCSSLQSLPSIYCVQICFHTYCLSGCPLCLSCCGSPALIAWFLLACCWTSISGLDFSSCLCLPAFVCCVNNGELFRTFDRISESYIWVLPVLGWDTSWILRKYATDTGLFGLLWLLAVLQWACVYGISRLYEHKMSKSG